MGFRNQGGVSKIWRLLIWLKDKIMKALKQAQLTINIPILPAMLSLQIAIPLWTSGQANNENDCL